MTRSIAVLSALAVAVAIPCWAQDSPPRVAVRDVKRFVGEDVTVCGRVVTHGCEKEADRALLHLDRPDWAGDVSIAVSSAQRTAFGERFEERYLGADVCASGRVERMEGRYVIVVGGPLALLAKTPLRDPDPGFAPGAVALCSPGVAIPVLSREVKPQYTREAMRSLIQGTVALEAVVLPDGTIGDVRVMRSLDSHTGLDKQAIAAVKQWRFKPGTLNGQPVPVMVRIDLLFRLK